MLQRQIRRDVSRPAPPAKQAAELTAGAVMLLLLLLVPTVMNLFH